jgi:hypothetical protein
MMLSIKATAIRYLLILSCLALIAGLQMSAARAATFTYSGPITAGSPTFNPSRPLGATNTCASPFTGLSAQDPGYNAFGFSVDVTGVYQIAMNSNTFNTPSPVNDGMLFLYQGSFDPNNPNTNLIAKGDAPSTCPAGSPGPCCAQCGYISCATLTAGTRYILVTTPNQTGSTGTFTNTISGPGNITSPTAAPGLISGRITLPDGTPLGGVVMTLSGTGSRFTITDASGFYQFGENQTDAFYSLNPFLVNYLFTPSALNFNLLADKTDAVFSAMPVPEIGNPIDTVEFFVRQQYLDFLGREPDQGGLEYWTSQIKGCGSDAGCAARRRNEVSAAFFKSAEFEQTGSFVYRLYRAGLGRSVHYTEFQADRAQVLDGTDLEARKAAFALSFVQRAEFAQKYVAAQSAESFVDALLDSAQQAAGVNLSAARAALISKYRAGGNLAESRSLAVRELIEQAMLKEAVYNDSFVTMEYFGYLRRDPEEGGRLFWLDVLNNRDQNNYLGMVCSFVTAAEYQKRFASLQTRFNSECGQ